MIENKDENQKQVCYLGRWVDKEFFRVFVYREGDQKLAQSYEEYQKLIASGTWFDSIENIPKIDSPRIRKSKHDTTKSER